MNLIEHSQNLIRNMGPLASTFDQVDEGVLVDSQAPKNLDQVLEQLASDADSQDSLVGSITETSTESDESLAEDEELDLSAGESDKASDPVRLYLREMGRVALLTKQQEVSIARRIEWGRNLALKAITRSPIAVIELLKVGEELEAGALNIRDVVSFSEQSDAEESEPDDKSAENLELTLQVLQNVRKLYRQAVKELAQFQEEQKRTRGKSSKKLLRLKGKLARTRLGIARAIRELRLKEEMRKRLVSAIEGVHKQVRLHEREVERYSERLNGKQVKPLERADLKRKLSAAKQRLMEIEVENHVSPVDIKRSYQMIVSGEAQA